MVTVKRKPDESNDNLINRFRQKAYEEDIVSQIKARDRHIKDSEKRKEQKKERKRLIQQKEKKNRR